MEIILNQVVLIGRLARDPELKYTATEGVPLVNFTIAVDRPALNQAGEKAADFIRILAWRKQAENCATYLNKGNRVAVEGRLQVRSYDDKEGVRRSIAEVVARRVVFLETRKDMEQGFKEEHDSFDNEGTEVKDDDVPF